MNKLDKQYTDLPYEVPQEVLIGLYRIMCGVSYAYPDSAEVYDNAKPGMKDGMKWILDWGKNNNINSRGDE